MRRWKICVNMVLVNNFLVERFDNIIIISIEPIQNGHL